MEYNELYHYGVKGMRWGVRRSKSQLSRGSRKRAVKKVEPHEDYKRAHSKKSLKSMSDAELRNNINRLQMERQYKDLNPGSVNKGKSYANKVLKVAGTVAATTTTALTIYNNINKIRQIVK